MTDIQVRSERMGDGMLKLHLDGLPFAAVLHHFTLPDLGAPHDHPWDFRSYILAGGYVEEVFDLTGDSRLVERRMFESFFVPAGHIHRIVELPKGDCHTLIMPIGPHRRQPGFYNFREREVWHRFHYEPDFRRQISFEAK